MAKEGCIFMKENRKFDGYFEKKQKDNVKHTFAEYCDSWLIMSGTRLKESSLAKYCADIENHIKPFFGTELPCQITSEKVDCFTQVLLYEKNCPPRRFGIFCHCSIPFSNI